MKQFSFFILFSFTFCACQQTNDTRCSIYDDVCQGIFLQNTALEKASTGVPEIGIPVIDPFDICDIELNILGLVYVKLLYGKAIGIGNCKLKSFKTDVEARYREISANCDKITIQGRYVIRAAPIMGKLCGWCNINGEGNGTIVVEDWFFKFCYNFVFEEQDDGQIYFRPLYNKGYIATERKVTVDADCVRRGNRDITGYIIKFINNNWKTIMNSYIGKFINDKSAYYFECIYAIFYRKVPANQYLNDDLESLVCNKSAYNTTTAATTVAD